MCSQRTERSQRAMYMEAHNKHVKPLTVQNKHVKKNPNQYRINMLNPKNLWLNIVKPLNRYSAATAVNAKKPTTKQSAIGNPKSTL